MNGIGFGPHRALLLDQFGQLIYAAWGEPGYIVGSALIKAEWRDVDVRVMFSDTDYAKHFDIAEDRHQNARWRAEMLAWSALGERVTGLPIDFQVERADESNEKYPNQQRNPIGFRWVTGRLRTNPVEEQPI